MSIQREKAEDKGIELEAEFVNFEDANGLMVFSDCQRLKQVILNLQSNALKFTSQGCVVIKVEPVRTEDGDSLLKVSVHDTGVGISE